MALIEEHEREEKNVASLQLLNSIKAKVEVPKNEKKERLFAKAKIRGHTVKALVDTRATNNFTTIEEAKRLGIYTSEVEACVRLSI